VRIRGSMIIHADSETEANRKVDELAASGRLGHVTCQVEDCSEEFHGWEEEEASYLIDGPFEV
jgi:hypothetical protein